jgi:hypothetical protein
MSAPTTWPQRVARYRSGRLRRRFYLRIWPRGRRYGWHFSVLSTDQTCAKE